MPDKTPRRPEEPTMAGTSEPISEADRLIAELDKAAQEAQSSGANEEAGKIETRKRTKAKAAEETEELQQRFIALKSDDNFVEECAYEWAFDALENDIGVAAPEGIYEKITALRKTGDALRKIVGIEPKTKAVLDKMDELQKLHDKLFEEIKTAAIDALEEVKKKHKGEESDFEKKFKGLLDSPLVKLVEYDSNSPEEREKGLKQEIIEFLLRPVVDGRLTDLEKLLVKTREKTTELKTKHQPLPDDYRDDATHYARQLGMQMLEGRKVSSSDLKVWLKREAENSENLAELIETQLSREKLALGVNHMVVEESLTNEHDETILREAMVAIRDHVGTLRKQESGVSWDFWGESRTPLKNPLAQKILGQYGEFGVSFPDNYYLQESFSAASRKLTPAGQIIGKDWEPHSGFRGTSSANLLGAELSTYFFSSQTSKEFGELFGGLDSTDKDVFEKARGRHKTLTNRQSSSFKDTQDPEQAKFLAEYPTAGEFIAKIFAGKGKLLNLRLAHEKVDAGIDLDKNSRREKSELKAIPEELSAAGWKKSKLGAWVEPGQNAREADGEYARLLERLSAPQIEAEHVFDVRGPDGEFHVYTTEQAVRIARLLKRDAQGIIRNYEEAVARAAGGEEQAKDLEGRVRTLDERLQELRTTNSASQRKIGELTRENDGARAVINESDRKAKQSAAEAGRLRKEKFELEQVVQKVIEELEEARREKPGLFGASVDKDKLKKAVDNALNKLRGR